MGVACGCGVGVNLITGVASGEPVGEGFGTVVGLETSAIVPAGTGVAIEVSAPLLPPPQAIAKAVRKDRSATSIVRFRANSLGAGHIDHHSKHTPLGRILSNYTI